jgi:HSP20 family protein
LSFRDREPNDWFRRFFSGSNSTNSDIIKEFIDSVGREIKRMFEQQQQFQDIQSKAPKELVREYKTLKGDKVREIGPIVYGYSVTSGLMVNQR